LEEVTGEAVSVEVDDDGVLVGAGRAAGGGGRRASGRRRRRTSCLWRLDRFARGGRRLLGLHRSVRRGRRLRCLHWFAGQRRGRGRPHYIWRFRWRARGLVFYLFTSESNDKSRKDQEHLPNNKSNVGSISVRVGIGTCRSRTMHARDTRKLMLSESGSHHPLEECKLRAGGPFIRVLCEWVGLRCCLRYLLRTLIFTPARWTPGRASHIPERTRGTGPCNPTFRKAQNVGHPAVCLPHSIANCAI